LGIAARRYCVSHDLAFTTSYHTRFPEYVRLRVPIPLAVSYAYLKWFHGQAQRTLVPSQSQKELLESRGFNNICIWGRGVDTSLFKPHSNQAKNKTNPKMVYAGRIAVEKNLEAFLSTTVPGEKILIGDGPNRIHLEKKYPQAQFLGFKQGEELVDAISDCDVFVFPSLTDTFGIVMLEAMACGLPVAAFPVDGPRDVVIQGETGYLHEDLNIAIEKALSLDRDKCRRHALTRTWESVTEIFLGQLVVNKRQQNLSRSTMESPEVSTKSI
jgi:glycosyltransferase involved in cell wall biosynthesis